MVLRQTVSVPAAPVVHGARLLILEAPYYAEITAPLAEGALAVVAEAGGSAHRVVVSGALELPQALALFVHADRIGRFAGPAKFFDGAIILGCVIRGDTSHYDTVCNEANRGLMEIALRHGVPLGNALLTVNTLDQAVARAQGGAANKGGDAARACLGLIAIERQLGASS